MRLTSEELASQKLSPTTLDFAVQSVKVNGYVLFEEVLPREQVTELQAAFVRLFKDHITRTDPNRGANRYQMHLPFMPPFNDASIITNAFGLPIIDALLGSDCVCHYFASDTPLPGSDHQRVHADIHLLFPEHHLSLPAYSIVLNVPLVDFTEENGPLEIWPGGSHTFPTPCDLEALAATMRSERVLMPAGSLLIRDMRMWHRGTPNRSDHARPNLALIYSRHWLKTKYPPIPIPRATYDGLSERAQQLFRFEDLGG